MYIISLVIKNWIIGYCNSRVFISLAVMGYEPLYHALQILLLLFQSSFLYFGSVFNKTIIPLALVGYLSSHIQRALVE